MANANMGEILVGILGKATDSLGASILTYAVALAAVGAIVMAMLELLKALLRLRYLFHRMQTDKWVGADAERRKEFIALTTGGYASESALFDQPVEKLMAQVQAGANMAMDFPDRYPKFYAFLTSQPDLRHTEDAALWLSYASGVSKSSEQGEALAASGEDREAGKARARLQNLAARKLDAFQTETAYRWARANQLISILMGAGLIYYMLQGTSAEQILSPAGIGLIALLGGMAAPLAKDTVSTLSSFRKA